jgi:hypothetical protein
MLTALTPLRLVGSTLLLALVALPDELRLKENDHKSLGKLVAAFFTAKAEEKGINEAQQKILQQIESSEKRLKGLKVLSCVSDLEEVFRIATEERLRNTLRKRGEVASTKMEAQGIDVTFAYCVPKKPAKGALPLILIACGEGETPADHLNTHWNDPALREGAILMAVDLGKDTSTWGVFGTPSAPGGTFQLMTALNLIQREFSVDHDRRYLAGSGKGFAAVEVTASSFPHVFAGLIGIGDVSIADTSVLDNFRSLPSLFLKGGEGAKAIETKLGELGFSNGKVAPEGGVTQAWEWIGSTPRTSHPTEITFTPKSDYARSVYWISFVGFQVSEGPRVHAKADKASNTITVDAQKIADIVVYLNDELVDMDKPVKIVINGTTHERTIERNATVMLDTQYSGGDWGRVFTAYWSDQVPAPK